MGSLYQIQLLIDFLFGSFTSEFLVLNVLWSFCLGVSLTRRQQENISGTYKKLGRESETNVRLFPL